ncbi:P-loop containing nucleoside triphosphate hydrolase protein [Kockovaella imperatae]|uniref:Gluconokinase n=1 Tax=Kockovaella imperatae TaxID=4999 RepID=A0A1Y1UBR8_9TREE|nr:P-loop containing nucleoside triphosphate hydrolase protein [Kockovaella imperatae]ORX35488.1 P-loop containing nucleoside triphosphate hydrolase protein [Kockovaella imperatae]
MVSERAKELFKEDDVELTVPPNEPRPVLLIVMGPASCGKSTIGSGIAEDLHLPFVDGDTLHPQSNIDKMSKGIPLTDDDRLPWLALIRSTAERVCKEQWERGEVRSKDNGGLGRAGIVIACSALKKWYRDILRGDPPAHPAARPEMEVHKPATDNLQTLFLYCHGTPELLAQRIAARKNHFMGAQMLKSQLATLELPRNEPGVAWVDIDGTPQEVRERALQSMKVVVRKEVDGNE